MATRTAASVFGNAVSRVFHPGVSVLAGLFCVGWVTGGWYWSIVSVLAGVVPPGMLAFILKACGVIENIDVPSRGQRVALLSVLIAMEIGAALFYLLMQAPRNLIVAQLAMTAGLAALAVGTVWTKVSAHAGLLAIMVAALVVVGGWSFAPLFILVPVIAVGRVIIDAHTWVQVMYASIVPPLATLLVGWGLLAIG